MFTVSGYLMSVLGFHGPGYVSNTGALLTQVTLHCGLTCLE